jgi:hypothetical protein
MPDDLIQKVAKAIHFTGIPLELEVAAIARRLGWYEFHSVEYTDPETDKPRELDLMLYKVIRRRRIELRVSCKSSSTKQFVFFTRECRSLRYLTELKITPVCDNRESRHRIPPSLESLRFFSHPRETVNYTVLAGENVDREARALLRDALMSAVTSVHHRILPDHLMYDRRGTVFFFVVVLKGRIFEAKFDETDNQVRVEESQYARWRGRIPVPRSYFTLNISDAHGRPVPFDNAFYWFGQQISVEFIKDTLFESFLRELEAAFEELEPDSNPVFGEPWIPENFPSVVGPAPSLDPIQPEEARDFEQTAGDHKAV